MTSFVAAQSHAQEPEREFAKYLRPYLFVLPKAPAAANSATDSRNQKFVVSLVVNADGTVRPPLAVEPHVPAVADSVNDAARFWLFYPDLSSDCKPAERAGKVGLEFEGNNGRAWVEFAAPIGLTIDGTSFNMSNDGPSVRYPREELRRGIEGLVTVAMKLRSDGQTTEHVVYFAAPRAQGLMEAALKHARSFKATFGTPIPEEYRCALVPYKFKIQ